MIIAFFARMRNRAPGAFPYFTSLRRLLEILPRRTLHYILACSLALFIEVEGIGSSNKQGRDERHGLLQKLFLGQQLRSLYVDHLAARVQSAVHFNLLAFELLHFILVVDVVGVTAGGILKHILVTRLHNRTREGLIARRLR
jgi:GGDEF domain-containing protein